MADPVDLLLLSGILMFLYDLVHIIIHGAARHDSCLAASVHGKLVNIIAGRFVLDKGSVCDSGIQKLLRLLVYTICISIHIVRELGFRPVNI